MKPINVQLDHAGYIVRGLEQQAARWSRLGFTLSPMSPQMGLNANGEFEPWATANRCAVFETGYLELIGLHRPQEFNPWASRLADFEGAHIIAFRTANADATHTELARRSDDFQAPVQRRRDAPFFVDGKWGTREMGFRNIFSVDARVPEARYIIIEHQTPEVLWQPCLEQHDNGAIALVSVSFSADNLEGVEGRLGLLSERATNSSRYDCANGGYVELLAPTQWQQRFPDAEPLPALRTGGLSSCTIRVRSLNALRALWHASNVEFTDGGERVWVGAQYTGGAPFEFIE